jgi:hypothetical protein
MKNLTFIIFAVLCFAIGFSSCDSGDQDLTKFTVIPGQGFINLRIGDPGSKVESELGKGFKALIGEGFTGNTKYNYFNDPKGIDIVFGEYDSEDLDINTLPIKAIYLYSEFEGMTQEGIKIGSARAEVIAAYGEPDEVDLLFSNSIYYVGMIISYDDLDKVRTIYIVEI